VSRISATTILIKLNGMIHYPVKILIAFGEAISGKAKFLHWLKSNGYPELAATANALHVNDEAFDWLMKHKFPHYGAFVKAVWDDEKALEWLKKHQFEFLALFAEACNEVEDALAWLSDHDLKIFIAISQKIAAYKAKKNYDLTDYHKIQF